MKLLFYYDFLNKNNFSDFNFRLKSKFPIYYKKSYGNYFCLKQFVREIRIIQLAKNNKSLSESKIYRKINDILSSALLRAYFLLTFVCYALLFTY